MEKPLAVGLIGAGPWAGILTGPMLAAGPETRLAGIWSRTAEKTQTLADRLDAPAFDDVDALIDASDAVAIVVAPDAQPEYALRAARAGKPMLLEKPLAADVAGAEAVVAAIEDAGVGALVTLTNRFNPSLAAFVDEVAAIEPLGGRGCFVSGAFLGGPFAYGWRLDRGAVLDVGPHLLDLLDSALGPIVEVRASGDRLGWTSITCVHESGLTSQGSLCCNSATDSRTEVEVFGRKGVARFDGRAANPMEIVATLRREFAGVARGETNVATPARALYLQRLIADIEAQLA